MAYTSLLCVLSALVAIVNYVISCDINMYSLNWNWTRTGNL